MRFMSYVCYLHAKAMDYTHPSSSLRQESYTCQLPSDKIYAPALRLTPRLPD